MSGAANPSVIDCVIREVGAFQRLEAEVQHWKGLVESQRLAIVELNGQLNARDREIELLRSGKDPRPVEPPTVMQQLRDLRPSRAVYSHEEDTWIHHRAGDVDDPIPSMELKDRR